MGVATVTSKGQLTIPADVRAEFGIEPGHRIYFFKQLDGQLGVKLVKMEKGAGRGALRAYVDRLQGKSLDDEIGKAAAEGVAERFARTMPRR